MNKVKFGIKNAHYSKVTIKDDGTPEFATPVKMPGAVSLSLEPKGETSSFYADDILYFSGSSNDGYEGTFEVAMVPEGFSKDIMGMSMDKNNVLVEKANDIPSYFALLFEFTGDEKAIRHCCYYCKATRPKQEAETKGEGIDPKTEELEFIAQPLPGSEIIKTSSTNSTTETIYNSWYQSVKMPNFQ